MNWWIFKAGANGLQQQQTDRLTGSTPAQFGPVIAISALAASIVMFPLSSQAASDPANPRLYQDRLKREKRPPEPPAPVAEQPGRAATAMPSVTAGEPVFLFRGATITGATVLPQDLLAQVYRPYLGKEISVPILAAIANRITSIYQEHGYALSRAIIPAQDLAAGTITIEVIEGHVETVRFTGTAAERMDLSAYRDAITAEKPARLSTMERELLLISRLDGVHVGQPSLEEIGELSGRFILSVETSFKPYDLAVALDNSGTRNVGRLQSFARGVINSPFGLTGALTANVAGVVPTPREWAYGDVAYDHSITPYARIGGSVSFGELHPDGLDRLIGTRKRQFDMQLRGSYILRLDRDSEWRIGSAFTYGNFDEVNFGGIFSRDRTRTIQLNTHYFQTLPAKGWVLGSLAVEQGLDIFGASQRNDLRLSTVDGDPRFTKATANLKWVQPLPMSFSLALDASGQVSASPLLTGDEFFLGGQRFGKGYDPGLLTGDAGAAASIELRYGKPVDWQLLREWQLFGFYDGGAVWDRGSTDPRTSLASAGLGLRLGFPYEFNLSVDVAFPLTYETPGTDHGHRPRVNFSLSKSF